MKKLMERAFQFTTNIYWYQNWLVRTTAAITAKLTNIEQRQSLVNVRTNTLNVQHFQEGFEQLMIDPKRETVKSEA
jgi:hypothetical protein